MSCRAPSNHAIKCLEKMKSLEKGQAGGIGRSNLIFPRQLSCYKLLESPLRHIGIRSMAFYSKNGAIMTIQPSALTPYVAENHSKKNNDTRRPHAQYERMNKLDKKFSTIMRNANSKVLTLQTDLRRMEDISHEFNKISRQRRVQAIEENMFGFGRTLTALNSKLRQMTSHQKELTNLFVHHADTLKKQIDQCLVGAPNVQHRLLQLEMKLECNNLDLMRLLRCHDEANRRVVEMEKMVQANMNVMLKEIRRTQWMQKGILSITSIGGIVLTVVVLHGAVEK